MAKSPLQQPIELVQGIPAAVILNEVSKWQEFLGASVSCRKWCY